MKILYLIDSEEYKYHKDIVKEFTDITGGEIWDMSKETRDIRFKDITDAGASAIITFDGVGLELRTVMDTLALNNVYARMAHILFHKPSFYGQDLFKLQNLSMFTYIPCSEDATSFADKYDQVPNPRSFGEFFYKADTEGEKNTNRESIKCWWDDFKREAML